MKEFFLKLFNRKNLKDKTIMDLEDLITELKARINELEGGVNRVLDIEEYSIRCLEAKVSKSQFNALADFMSANKIKFERIDIKGDI